MNMNRFLFALFIGLPVLAQSPAPGRNPTKNAVGMEFVKIAPGEFVMGCSTGENDCDADEKPAHRVQITKVFEIGKYEVTQAQWQAVMGSNPSTIKGDDRPVETISKDEAQDFLAKLTARNDGYRYRLPTEAEWEYAARAGGAQPISLDEVAWYAANSGDETHPVGQKKPNAWGLYDTLGNVREWVSDQYAMNFYANSPPADPTGPEASQGGPPRRGNFGRGRRFNKGAPNEGGTGDQPQAIPIAYRAAAPQNAQDGPQGQPGGQAGQGGPPQGNFGRGGGGNFGFGRGGPGGRARQLPIMRGGAWDNRANFVRLSARYHYYGPTLKLSDIGFRAVREPIRPDGGD
jgi:formylglycine-generating enzyme required for sulfatase activity